FQIIGSAVILAGSGLALWPEKKIDIAPPLLRAGIICGALGALGQALGAVITRKADSTNMLIHLQINGMTAAYQRMFGALIIGIIIFVAIEIYRHRKGLNISIPASVHRKAAPWIVLNSLSGLVLGISCYQWALQNTATGI